MERKPMRMSRRVGVPPTERGVVEVTRRGEMAVRVGERQPIVRRTVGGWGC